MMNKDVCEHCQDEVMEFDECFFCLDRKNKAQELEDDNKQLSDYMDALTERMLEAESENHKLSQDKQALEDRVRELVEQAFMAGQIDCGVDPSHASSQEYADKAIKPQTD